MSQKAVYLLVLVAVLAAACSAGGETTQVEIGDGFIRLSSSEVRSARTFDDLLLRPRPSFEVRNVGDEEHGLAVVTTPTGLLPDLPVSLTIRAGGGVVGPGIDEVGLHVEEGGLILEPGKQWTGPALGPGEYVILCNLAGHYKAGEWAVLTVLEQDGSPPKAREPREEVVIPVGPPPGEQLPPWSGLLLDGGTLGSDDLAGKPTLFLIWWDGMPVERTGLVELQTLAAKWSEQVQFVAVDTLREPDEDRARRIIEDGGYRFPVIVDHDGRLEHIFEINAGWLLVDARGAVLAILDADASVDAIDELLDGHIDVDSGLRG